MYFLVDGHCIARSFCTYELTYKKHYCFYLLGKSSRGNNIYKGDDDALWIFLWIYLYVFLTGFTGEILAIQWKDVIIIFSRVYVYITCTGNFLRSHGASVNVVCAAFNAFLTFLLSKRIFIFILFVFIRLRHVVGHLLCETVHARPIGPILITPRLNSVICTCNNDNFLPLSLSHFFLVTLRIGSWSQFGLQWDFFHFDLHWLKRVI